MKVLLQHSIILLLIVFFTVPCFAVAEEVWLHDNSEIEVRDASGKMTSYLTDKGFSYMESSNPPQLYTWWEMIKWQLRKYWSRMFSEVPGGRYILYLLVTAGMLTLVYFLFKSEVKGLLYSRGPSAKGSFNVGDDIEDIAEVDADAMIRQAIAENDYRKAVRFYYLKLLKYLAEKDLIKWRMDKTNNDYLLELRKKGITEGLPQLSLIYETVWYGNFPLTAENYSVIEAEFGDYYEKLATYK